MKLSSLAPALLLAVLLPLPSSGFAPVSQQPVAFVARQQQVVPAHCAARPATSTALSASDQSDDDDDDDDRAPQAQSRLEGLAREPSASEISIMDDMITKLANAKPYELPNAVSKAIRVVSSPRFFLRIAERADVTADAVEKAKLSALAENLVSTLEAVVSTAEDKLEERAKEVESVVKAASEPGSGEFLVPLSSERVDAMRTTLLKLDPASLDEGFLSTVDAWMNKSHQDGMDGMVGILQKVLQMYAGAEIKRARATLQANVGAAVSGQSQASADEVLAEEEREGPKPAAALLERLMEIDTDLWEAEMRKSFADKEEGGVSPQSLMGEVQRTIEGVVLGLENGSMAQRVQAEFLRELVSRIETLEKQMQS